MKDYYFFWNGIASQWAKSKFVFNKVEYNCAEQFMMAGKAKVFEDETILDRIMASSNPKEQKAFGRKIHNFDSDIWMEHATDIVTIGNVMKFEQNLSYRKWLFDIKNNYSKMVEASPYDKVWGIGLREGDSRCINESTWLGQNLLGKSIDKAYEFMDNSVHEVINQEYHYMVHNVSAIFK